MTEVAPPPALTGRRPGRTTGTLPGEPAMWFFVIGDLWIFACYFACYAYDRGRHPAALLRSQQHLGQGRGVAETVLLLTSSLLVAGAVRAVRSGRTGDTGRLLLAGGACGVGFLAVKAFEWGPLIASGRNLGTDTFFMYYFALTGLHALHVLLGLGILAFAYRRVTRSDASAVLWTETGATYWHMVDVLWVVLFALFYVAR